MIKTRFSFCVQVGNRGLLTGVREGMVFISGHLVYQASLGSKRLPRAAVVISARACLWLIIRMRHSLFFVLSPYFICLPSPAVGETSCCHGDSGHNKFEPSNSRCPWVTSSYLWTKQQLMKVMIIKINVYPQLILDVPPEKMLESTWYLCPYLETESLRKVTFTEIFGEVMRLLYNDA